MITAHPAARAAKDAGPRVLVTGATGMQGGAAALALHRAGLNLSALVRSPTSAAARHLAEAGIALRAGDLEDASSLAAACAGHSAVFSVQPAPYADPDSERRQAGNLITAAQEVGVQHMVHASVSGTGWREGHPVVAPGSTGNYWDSKEAVEELVRRAGFDAYTIFKPAFYMENFVAPKVGHMFPVLAEGELLVAAPLTAKLALLASADIGNAVLAAVTDRHRFTGAEIELGGDVVTFAEIAEVLTSVTGRRITPVSLPAEEVDARLGRRSWSATQAWIASVGYPARPAHAAPYGLPLTTFPQWAEQHRDPLRAAVTAHGQ
ncbi:NmrA family NAD(P)-binding protein [Streptomyces sp. NPDC005803]|uniref:NmrA family NAD(P)-binding protein n=1 Tax=Streptomyces sp. NPDC005803 TaxID=3154297 RepID=UPI0033D04B2A